LNFILIKFITAVLDDTLRLCPGIFSAVKRAYGINKATRFLVFIKSKEGADIRQPAAFAAVAAFAPAAFADWQD